MRSWRVQTVVVALCACVISMWSLNALGASLGDAVDNLSLVWTTGGDADWFSQTTTTYDGQDAAKSGDIGNNQESWMQTIVIGPGTVSFWWKVSSEAHFTDTLAFWIDGTREKHMAGEKDWQQESYSVGAGSHTLKWRYKKDPGEWQGSDCGWVDQIAFVPDLGNAVDSPSLSWTTGGAADWFAQTVTTHDGQDAAESGNIGNSQESWMETTVTGPGTVSFWWKVSSESDYDYLEFWIDSTREQHISGGSADWEQKSYHVAAGSHTLKWRYLKDVGISRLSDCGWVDQVTFVQGYELQGAGDFNGDGADLCYRNPVTGEVTIRLMTFGEDSGVGSPGTADLAWEIQNFADFNGDGKGDILWHRPSTGDVAVWLIDGTITSRTGIVGNVNPADGWEIKGCGDFNGDGKDDILWYKPATGQVAIWLIRGKRRIGAGHVGTVNPALGWEIKDCGDFNGDGKDDILWYRPSTGDVAVWLIRGTRRIGARLVGAVDPALGLEIKGCGDFNGDGNADILWYWPSTRELAVWFIAGKRRIGAGWIHDRQGIDVSVPPDFAVQPDIVDFDGDGKGDLLLHNSTTDEIQVWCIRGSIRTRIFYTDSFSQ